MVFREKLCPISQGQQSNASDGYQNHCLERKQRSNLAIIWVTAALTSVTCTEHMPPRVPEHCYGTE